MRHLLASLLVLAAFSSPAEARRYRTTYRSTQTTYRVQTMTVQVEDAGGFCGWLNGVRAQYGLGAVGHDPSLDAWAAQNNIHQASRGIGHYIMGPARRQNSGMGAYHMMPGMWMSSPAHRAALLDPSIRFIGIAGHGVWWTFNAY